MSPPSGPHFLFLFLTLTITLFPLSFRTSTAPTLPLPTHLYLCPNACSSFLPITIAGLFLIPIKAMPGSPTLKDSTPTFLPHHSASINFSFFWVNLSFQSTNILLFLPHLASPALDSSISLLHINFCSSHLYLLCPPCFLNLSASCHRPHPQSTAFLLLWLMITSHCC